MTLLALSPPIFSVGKESCKKCVVMVLVGMTHCLNTSGQGGSNGEKISSVLRKHRCYLPVNFGEVVKREVHHFSDASTTGYGQYTYLRLINSNGGVHCAFIMGKSHMSPTRVTTIPRRELTATKASLAVRNMLREELV